MDDSRDRLNLLGYTYMAVLVIFYITGVNTTACTDLTGMDKFFHVLPMCRSGTLRNTRLVIDTWDMGYPNVYSCTCTVTLHTGSAPPTATTTVTVQEYPGLEPVSSCGSIFRITSTTSTGFTETGCTPIPATPAYIFGRSDLLTLTQSRTDVSTQWQSGHCIFISQDILAYNLIVTCQSAQGIQTTFPTTTGDIATTTTETRETTTTSQSRKTTTTFKSRETTTTTQPRETTTYSIPNSESTTLEQEKCVQQPQPQHGYPLSAVVVPLVVTTLLITVSVVAHVILYRRRLALVKQPEYTNAVMTSPQTVNYDSLDLSNVAPPNIYADTSTGQMYANTAMES